MVRTIRAFLRDGVKAVLRYTHRELVKATPKRTQFAAGWAFGLGGPPFAPQDKPTQTIYPLRGDSDVDADLAGFQLGDEIVGLSPATYIKFLNAGTSPQADANFVQDAISEAQDQFRGWRWEGIAA